MGITVHFINESWCFQQLTLDFIELEGSHTGRNIAGELIEILNLYGISTKVCNLFIL